MRPYKFISSAGSSFPLNFAALICIEYLSKLKRNIANFSIHGNKYDRYILGRTDIKIQIWRILHF